MNRAPVLLLALLLTPTASPVLTSDSDGPASTRLANEIVAEIRPPEVRIRKLYLVRPDLMRYPLPYEVIC